MAFLESTKAVELPGNDGWQNYLSWLPVKRIDFDGRHRHIR